MSGHGWVTPNADGTKARCGGPGICTECALEAWYLSAKSGSSVPQGEAAAATEGQNDNAPFLTPREEIAAIVWRAMQNAQAGDAINVGQAFDVTDKILRHTPPTQQKVEAARKKAMNRMDALTTDRCDASIQDAQRYVTQAFLYFIAALGEAQRSATAAQQRAEGEQKTWKVRVCGVDCRPGDQYCNGYCKGDTPKPPPYFPPSQSPA